MDLGGPVPTYNDLSIDDNLTQLERVVKYSTSTIALQRLVHVKMLAETAASLTLEDTVKNIIPLILQISFDLESVIRQVLAEQLEQLAKICINKGPPNPGEQIHVSPGYRVVIEKILPCLKRMLMDEKSEPRKSVGDSMKGIAPLLRPSDMGQHILTSLLQLAHDDLSEDMRMTAAILLNDMADIFGPDLCKQFVTPDMVSLGVDPAFRVRKVTALNLHNVCRVVGEEYCRQKLLPAFIKLTKDDKYRVRKACTESIVEISKAIGPELSSEVLIEVYECLSNDTQKVVRNGAMQHLGQFISTLLGEKVSPDLVKKFLSPVEIQKNSNALKDEGKSAKNGAPKFAYASNSEEQEDTAQRWHCAFSFPGVALTIGPNRWNELRGAYKTLTRDHEWNVRKTLAYSLHEIAKNLNSDQTEMDLLPEVEFFLNDIEEVRAGVVCRLASIYSRLSSTCRERCLPLLSQVLESSNPFNWRLRDMLASQLPQFATLFAPDSIYSSLIPLTFKLLDDPVYSVRETAFEAIAPLMASSSRSTIKECGRFRQNLALISKIDGGSLFNASADKAHEDEANANLNNLGSDAGSVSSGTTSLALSSGGEERRAAVVSMVREFAHSQSYQQRQMYIYICQRLQGHIARDDFINDFMPSLVELASDRVVNVRIALSRTIGTGRCPRWLLDLPPMQRAIRILSADTNSDVRHFMSFLPENYMTSLKNMHFDDKVSLWQETSSCVSDESTRTQWSISTQRSERESAMHEIHLGNRSNASNSTTGSMRSNDSSNNDDYIEEEKEEDSSEAKEGESEQNEGEEVKYYDTNSILRYMTPQTNGSLHKALIELSVEESEESSFDDEAKETSEDKANEEKVESEESSSLNERKGGENAADAEEDQSNVSTGYPTFIQSEKKNVEI